MNYKSFSRRIFLLGVSKLFLLLVIVMRLFYLQIKENNYFVNLSDKNKTNYIPIIPKRGIIFDRFNISLADNTLVWQALFIKSQLQDDINVFINNLNKILNLTDYDKARIINSYNSSAPYNTILIQSDLKKKDIASIETFHNIFPMIFITGVYKRIYNYPFIISHILGYIGPVDNKYRNNDTPTWLLGKTGIELSLDSILKGNLGYQKYEINAKGNVVKKLDETLPSMGQNISLTIDIELQNFVYNTLKDLSAAAVVLDTETGEILSMVSTPSFDPNEMVRGISYKEWNNLLNNGEDPLTNKALKGLYPPASTLKPFIALLSLEKGIIKKNDKLECKGYIDIGNRRFHCWKKQGHGWINIEQSLIHSCDVFYYKLGILLNRQDIRNLGVNIGTIDNLLPLMPDDNIGRLPLTNSNPPLGSLAISAIGQEQWLLTPLHIANMGAILANNGKQIQLKILKEMYYKDKIIYSKLSQVKSNLPFSRDNINLIQNALYKVVNFDYGTGHSAFTNDPEWSISGKTGTAQVVSITAEQRFLGKTESSLRKFKEQAIFMGYFPSFSPKYSISVVVQHAGFSATSAAPIAGKIANFVKTRHILYEKQKQYLEDILNNE